MHFNIYVGNFRIRVFEVKLVKNLEEMREEILKEMMRDH